MSELGWGRQVAASEITPLLLETRYFHDVWRFITGLLCRTNTLSRNTYAILGLFPLRGTSSGGWIRDLRPIVGLAHQIFQ
jgi:hypothetical protein